MRWYKADFHVHGVLSPCGSLAMSPQAVLAQAKAKKLDMIALTDHNSTDNIRAYAAAFAGSGIKFFPGIEIQTAEEIHIVAIHDDIEVMHELGRQVYDSLFDIANDPDFFGDQPVINKYEEIVKFKQKALINSSTWSLEETIHKLAELACFYFPAHINASAYSLIGQLGFIPPDLAIQTLEISANANTEQIYADYPFLCDYHLITNSDAHYVDDIAKAGTMYYLDFPSLANIKNACNKKQTKIYSDKEVK